MPLINDNKAYTQPLQNYTAIFDRLVLTLFDVRRWLGKSLDYEAVTIEILASPPATTDFVLHINGEEIKATSGAGPTVDSVALLMEAAVNASAQPVTAVATGGKYAITADVAGTPFTINLDHLQDIVADNADDFFFAAIIPIAKQVADNYVSNPFALVVLNESTGAIESTTDQDIPDSVRVGVLQLISFLENDRQQTAVSGGVGPVRQEKAGDLSVTYMTIAEATGGAGDTAAIAGRLPAIVKSLLEQYRLAPGF